MSNYYIAFLAALVPMIIGAGYYHPKAMGASWMKVNGFTQESLQGANMLVIFGVSYLFSLFLAAALSGMVIHQSAFASLVGPESFQAGSDAAKELQGLMDVYGEKHRTFGHGALHGAIAALFVALPLIGINGLFERRGWKYIWIHTGYWIITLSLMGGILCQFG